MICVPCGLRRATRVHLSTRRHRRLTSPVYRMGKPARMRYVPRDWAAEVKASEFDDWLATAFVPADDTYVDV